MISDWFGSRPGRNCLVLVNVGKVEQVIKNRCLNGGVHVYVKSLKWNIISDKYFQWREVSSWDFPKKENRCILCKQEKLLLYWKGLQSSHTILGQLSRAFQLDGSVGIAAECHSWCPGWSVLLPFVVGCSVVHP